MSEIVITTADGPPGRPVPASLLALREEARRRREEEGRRRRDAAEALADASWADLVGALRSHAPPDLLAFADDSRPPDWAGGVTTFHVVFDVPGHAVIVLPFRAYVEGWAPQWENGEVWYAAGTTCPSLGEALLVAREIYELREEARRRREEEGAES